jgi:hypothetical protein
MTPVLAVAIPEAAKPARSELMIMPPERATHSILYLTGEVHALLMFCQALAKTHHAPQELFEQLEIASQLGLAHLEQLPEAGDVVIDGYQFVIGAIRRIVEAGVRDRP